MAENLSRLKLNRVEVSRIPRLHERRKKAWCPLFAHVLLFPIIYSHRNNFFFAGKRWSGYQNQDQWKPEKTSTKTQGEALWNVRYPKEWLWMHNLALTKTFCSCMLSASTIGTTMLAMAITICEGKKRKKRRKKLYIRHSKWKNIFWVISRMSNPNTNRVLIAEHLTTRLIIMQRSQFTFICMYVCMYVYLSHFN